MDKATFEQGNKLFASFAEQHPMNDQAQGIIGSGVIKLLCHANFAKYNSWRMAQALGLCEPQRITVPSRKELLVLAMNAVRAGRLSCENVPDSFFGNRQYDLNVALFLIGRSEEQEGNTRLAARLSAIGYSTPEFNEMVAFALSTDREQLHKLWPLVPHSDFITVGSLERCHNGFPWVVYRNEEKLVSVYDHFPGWDNSFILGVKRIDVAA